MKKFYFQVDLDDKDQCKQVDKRLVAEIEKDIARDAVLDEINRNQKPAHPKKRK